MREPEPQRFCGKVIGSSGLTRIRHVLRDHPHASQIDVCRRVCAALDLRRPNGPPALRGCVRLLQKLARGGRLRLPTSFTARRSRGGPRRSAVAANVDDAFRGAAAPAGDGLYLRRVETGERGAFHVLIRAHNYLGAKPAAGECVRHVAFFDRTPAA